MVEEAAAAVNGDAEDIPGKTPKSDALSPDREEFKWEGSHCIAASGGKFVLIFAVYAVFAVLTLIGKLEELTGWGRGDTFMWGSVVFAALLAYVFVKALYKHVSLRYRVSTQRIFLDEGLFKRVKNEIEVIRVDDVSVEQTLFGRMFSVGDVTIDSTDPSHPHLVLTGVKDPVGVKELIRESKQVLRSARGMYVERL